MPLHVYTPRLPQPETLTEYLNRATAPSPDSACAGIPDVEAYEQCLRRRHRDDCDSRHSLGTKAHADCVDKADRPHPGLRRPLDRLSACGPAPACRPVVSPTPWLTVAFSLLVLCILSALVFRGCSQA